MSDESYANEESAQRLLSGRAWEDYCEVLKVAGRAIERFGDEPTALDRAEWYRFLTRLTRNGLERFVENCEPERPRPLSDHIEHRADFRKEQTRELHKRPIIVLPSRG